MTEAILSTKLQSGATILTEHMPGLRSATVGIWVKRGSRHEPRFQPLPFIEHAVFKGTERRSVMDIASSPTASAAISTPTPRTR